MQNSFLKIHQNYSGALAYFAGPVTGLISYIGEGATSNNNKFVKFHGLQSTIYFVAVAIVRAILNIIPFIGIIRWLFDIVVLVSWVYLMVSAFSGKELRIPIIGDICWEQVNK